MPSNISLQEDIRFGEISFLEGSCNHISVLINLAPLQAKSMLAHIFIDVK